MRRGDAAWRVAGAHDGLGLVRRPSSSASRSRSPARWWWSASCPITTRCIRRPAISPWAGWWSRTCSRCWRIVLLPALFGRSESASRSGSRSRLTAAEGRRRWSRSRRFVGARVIPRVLDRVAATKSRELFTLTVLVIALGIAVGSAQVFGVSMALGAFLAGMVVGRSDYSLRAASDALPMRDAFAVLFFVSVGHAARSGVAARFALAVRGHARDRPDHQPGRRRSLFMWAVRQPFKASADRGDRARADRRVLLHPVDAWPRARPLHDGGDQHASSPRRSSRSSLNPLLYRTIEPIVGVGVPGSPGCARWLDRLPSIDSGRDARREAQRTARASRGADWLWTDRHAPWRGCSRKTASSRRYRDQHRHRSRASASDGRRCHLRRCDPAGNARAKPASPAAGNLILTSAGMANSTEVIRAAREVNPEHSRAGAGVVPARSCRT